MTYGRSAAVVGALWLAVAALSAQTAPPPTPVDVGGYKLNARLAGEAKAGVPAVVFESGLGATMPSWGSVPADISRLTKTVVYERAGIGASEPGPEPRTVKQITTELHALLTRMAVPPPYVLVGHSYGGPIIHTFAATYPKEIAGLVYVDPTDFTQTDADMDAIWRAMGVDNGREALRKAQEQLMAAVSPGIRAEAREVDRVERGGFAEFRAAGDPPDVPTVVLLAGRRQPLPPGIQFPGDYDRFSAALLEQRRDHFGRVIERASKGALVETSKSGHFIHSTEPDLLVWAIQRVLSASAMSHPELDRFVGEYQLAPTFAITITRDGDKLLGQATGQPGFQLNPESATTFSVNIVDARIEFEVDAAATVTGLVLVQNGRRIRGAKTK